MPQEEAERTGEDINTVLSRLGGQRQDSLDSN